ncbi:MAG: hypothetical protein J6Y37_05290 [Paludibacteraceae bacterium]|nr:hypothetical protein [Paludibacteraceae bacterium]
MSNENNNNEKRILWTAGILAVFGCLAPIIFSRSAICSAINFSETGQIGDTIGGTMTPIVSLAAVILTYLAFRKQVEANKIQTDQFNKTLDTKKEDENKKLKNTIELYSFDIDNTIKDIENRIKIIDEFIPTNLYGEEPIKEISSTCLNRYNTIDRSQLYQSFKVFIKDGNKEDLFRKTFSRLDYYNEAVIEFKDLRGKNNNDNKKTLDKIFSDFELFIKEPMTQKEYDKFITAALPVQGILKIENLEKALTEYIKDKSSIKDTTERMIRNIEILKARNKMFNNELIELKARWEMVEHDLDQISIVLHKNLNV